MVVALMDGCAIGQVVEHPLCSGEAPTGAQTGFLLQSLHLPPTGALACLVKVPLMLALLHQRKDSRTFFDDASNKKFPTFRIINKKNMYIAANFLLVRNIVKKSRMIHCNTCVRMPYFNSSKTLPV